MFWSGCFFLCVIFLKFKGDRPKYRSRITEVREKAERDTERSKKAERQVETMRSEKRQRERERLWQRCGRERMEQENLIQP